jgi:hypothetical protein
MTVPVWFLLCNRIETEPSRTMAGRKAPVHSYGLRILLRTCDLCLKLKLLIPARVRRIPGQVNTVPWVATRWA